MANYSSITREVDNAACFICFNLVPRNLLEKCYSCGTWSCPNCLHLCETETELEGQQEVNICSFCLTDEDEMKEQQEKFIRRKYE